MTRLVTALLLSVVFSGTAFSANECKSEADAYGRIQTITANMLNYLDNPAKMREVSDYYGEQNQIATSLMKEGKYQEACDVYQGVIDKYGMKTIEQQYYEKYPEKRPENMKKAETESPAATSTTMEAADAAVESSDVPAE